MKTSILIKATLICALFCLNSLQIKAITTVEITEEEFLSKAKIILAEEGADSDFFPNDLKHIFLDKEGHFKEDTPENRNILREVSKDRNNFIGKDQFGKNWLLKRYQMVNKYGLPRGMVK